MDRCASIEAYTTEIEAGKPNAPVALITICLADATTETGRIFGGLGHDVEVAVPSAKHGAQHQQQQQQQQQHGAVRDKALEQQDAPAASVQDAPPQLQLRSEPGDGAQPPMQQQQLLQQQQQQQQRQQGSDSEGGAGGAGRGMAASKRKGAARGRLQAQERAKKQVSFAGGEQEAGQGRKRLQGLAPKGHTLDGGGKRSRTGEVGGRKSLRIGSWKKSGAACTGALRSARAGAWGWVRLLCFLVRSALSQCGRW